MYVPYEQICTFIPMYGYIHLVGTTIQAGKFLRLVSVLIQFLFAVLMEPITGVHIIKVGLYNSKKSWR